MRALTSEAPPAAAAGSTKKFTPGMVLAAWRASIRAMGRQFFLE